VPESPETSVSEIEGGQEPHWLNEFTDEEDKDEEVLPTGGDTEAIEGSKARGGTDAPEGSQAARGARVVPFIIVDDVEDGAPQGGSVHPSPQGANGTGRWIRHTLGAGVAGRPN